MERFEDVLRDKLEECLTAKGLKDFHSATPSQRGKALTEFYLKEIGQYLYQIYDDDIDDNICDGKGDLGIDFAIQKDREWLIFQSKYKGQGSSLTMDEIAGFFQIYPRIIDNNFFEENANNTLKEILLDFRPDDSIQFIFITNDKITGVNEAEFNRLKLENETKNEMLSFELKGLTDLKRDYKSVLAEVETISEEISIGIETLDDTFSNQKRSAYLDLSSAIDKERKYKSLLCTIKGTTLRALWQQHKSRLFNYNIRGFLGENAINKKMKETIEGEPDKFYFYNNGISAICTDIIPEFVNKELRSLKCKNFSIINGAQTTTTIGRFKDELKLKDVRVLLKITKAEDYKKEKGLNKNIITFNNSQTVIKASDFRSNDDIQIFLENKLPDFIYKGTIPFRKVRYLRKRLKVQKRKEVLDASMESLARALYVFDNDPILIFKGTKYLFDTDSDVGKYWMVFGIDKQEVDLYDTKRLEKTVGIFFLWTKVEEKIKTLSKALKSQNKETIRYQALLAKWHILWAYGYILNTFYQAELESIFRRLSNGKLFDKSNDNFIEKWFSKIHNTIAKCIEKNYKASRKKESQEDIQSFNFKNWLRNNAEFEELITEFKYMDKSDFPFGTH